MKLKKILKEIKERWVMGTEATEKGEYREIFMNPSPNELSDIEEYGGMRYGDDMRFIAVKKTQNVYISSADVFHRTIAEEIDELDPVEGVYMNFSGIGKYRNGIVEINDYSDVFDFEGYEPWLYELCKDLVGGRYDWLTKYNFDLSYIVGVAMDELEYLKDEGYEGFAEVG